MAAHSEGHRTIPPVAIDQSPVGWPQWLREMAQSINLLSSWVGTTATPGGGGGGTGSGTVTSVTAGTGLAASPNPVVAAGTIALTVPVSVANGGTGATTPSGALGNLGGIGGNQNIVVSGDADGSGTTAITLVLDTVNANVGTFQGLTVNGKGLVTAAVNQGYITSNQNIVISGDVDGSGTTAITLTLDTVNSNVGTFQGITVNAKGLVTAATNQSYLTGNQTITLSGDLSGSGTTSINAQIAANAVGTTEIANSNVTYAKIQNTTAARLLGNPTGSAAAPSEISLGTNLSFAGTVLNATGGGGSGTVTNITAGTGITLSPSPITATGSVALTVPVVVSSGGTGQTSLTQYHTLAGNGTAAITTILPGADGTIYASNGASAMPSFRSQTALIDLLVGGGVQGQILYRNNVVWTPLAPGTAGQSLRTGGAAANVAWAAVNLASAASVTGTLPVANGGTNAATAGAALTSLGAAPLASPAFTGAPSVTGNLTVTGTIYTLGATASLFLEDQTNAANDWVLYSTSTSGTTSFRVGFSGDKLRLESSGVFVTMNASAYKPGGGPWLDSSDIRTKEAIVDYNRGLEAVLQLRPILYQKNGRGGTIKDGKTYVGFVADEVEPVMPEMVGNVTEKLDPEDAEFVDIKTLDTNALTYALVNCIKELAAKVEALEAK